MRDREQEEQHSVLLFLWLRIYPEMDGVEQFSN